MMDIVNPYTGILYIADKSYIFNLSCFPKNSLLCFSFLFYMQ